MPVPQLRDLSRPTVEDDNILADEAFTDTDPLTEEQQIALMALQGQEQPEPARTTADDVQEFYKPGGGALAAFSRGVADANPLFGAGNAVTQGLVAASEAHQAQRMQDRKIAADRAKAREERDFRRQEAQATRQNQLDILGKRLQSSQEIAEGKQVHDAAEAEKQRAFQDEQRRLAAGDKKRIEKQVRDEIRFGDALEGEIDLLDKNPINLEPLQLFERLREQLYGDTDSAYLDFLGNPVAEPVIGMFNRVMTGFSPEAAEQNELRNNIKILNTLSALNKTDFIPGQISNKEIDLVKEASPGGTDTLQSLRYRTAIHVNATQAAVDKDREIRSYIQSTIAAGGQEDAASLRSAYAHVQTIKRRWRYNFNREDDGIEMAGNTFIGRGALNDDGSIDFDKASQGAFDTAVEMGIMKDGEAFAVRTKDQGIITVVYSQPLPTQWQDRLQEIEAEEPVEQEVPPVIVTPEQQ